MKTKILKNASLYLNGTTRRGTLVIKHGRIAKIILNENTQKKKLFRLLKRFITEIDCDERLILPGLIDIHSHLRDMAQSEKETFLTGTKAAAFNGITTVFNMPNTTPPANNSKQMKLWLKKAKNNLYIDVGFIAGIPDNFNPIEIREIIKQKIIGFKIYPHKPLNNLDWTNKHNLYKLFDISSKYGIPIFIHPECPILNEEETNFQNQVKSGTKKDLDLYNDIKPNQNELNYVKFVVENYKEYIHKKSLNFQQYPIVHLCHISSKQSFEYLLKIQESDEDFRITMEVTPHHLLLNKTIQIDKSTIAKVDPPLRDTSDQLYLYDQLKRGTLKIIASDHAPHTSNEKDQPFYTAPSGFPEFDTYPLILLGKVLNGEIELKNFVQACSEFPAFSFNLKKKGFIKVGYNADLVIIEKVNPYSINTINIRSKAKFTPYHEFKTTVRIWKVFLRGIEVNRENITPKGKIFRR